MTSESNGHSQDKATCLRQYTSVVKIFPRWGNMLKTTYCGQMLVNLIDIRQGNFLILFST